MVEVETDTERLVMRSSPDPDALSQAKVSQRFAALGVGPEIREVEATESGVWTVAARVFPGYTLKNRFVPIEQLAAALHPLQGRRAPAHLPTLTVWLSKRLQDDKAIDLPSGATAAPRAERQQAAQLLTQLTSQTTRLLCHGDTSSKNILTGPAGKLYLIDPRGLSGDVAYDVAVAAWKTAGNELIRTRAVRLAKLMGIDRERVEAWLTVAETARV
ncbi:aminoglycoside phosphotransferase family protein [Actinomadura madurae]|uniref:phosphotransferase n=1 Tax=Actinomadura madurae TaxID=1993 RepID=UPI0039998F62